MINLNSKKLTKIVSFFMIVLMVVSVFSTVFADMPSATEFGGSNSTARNNVKGVMNQILGIIQVIAVGIAVIMLVVLAIKYISAAPSEKADIKKSAITYVVGAVILFGASGLLEIIKGFATDLTSTK